MPHGITQCYLPPGRGDIPALTPAEAGTRLSDSGMQGWVDLVGRLPLLSTRPAVTPATLKKAATNFAAWWTEAQWVWTVCLRLLPDSVTAAIWTRAYRRRRHCTSVWTTAHHRIYRLTASRSPVLTGGGICVPPTVIYMYLPYRVSGSTLTAVGRCQLLARCRSWPFVDYKEAARQIRCRSVEHWPAIGNI